MTDILFSFVYIVLFGLSGFYLFGMSDFYLFLLGIFCLSCFLMVWFFCDVEVFLFVVFWCFFMHGIAIKFDCNVYSDIACCGQCAPDVAFSDLVAL